MRNTVTFVLNNGLNKCLVPLYNVFYILGYSNDSRKGIVLIQKSYYNKK